MAKVSTKRNHYGASFFGGMLVGAILYILVCVGLVMGFVSGVEDFKFEMLFDDGVWDVVYEEVSDRFTNLFAWEDKVANYEDEPTETVEFISFEGVKLSEVAKLEMLKYIDFTIPYNWAFGKVDVENPSTEEAIAITADNVVLTISLRNIEMAADKESILWAEEALVFELKNEYPNHLFTKPDMFEDEVAIVQGVNDANSAKLYIAIIPVEDKTIYVNYSFMAEDWLADLYFNTVIREMLIAH